MRSIENNGEAMWKRFRFLSPSLFSEIYNNSIILCTHSCSHRSLLNIVFLFNNYCATAKEHIRAVDEFSKVVMYAIMGLFRSLLFKRNEQPPGNEGSQHYVKG